MSCDWRKFFWECGLRRLREIPTCLDLAKVSLFIAVVVTLAKCWWSVGRFIRKPLSRLELEGFLDIPLEDLLDGCVVFIGVTQCSLISSGWSNLHIFKFLINNKLTFIFTRSIQSPPAKIYVKLKGSSWWTGVCFARNELTGTLGCRVSHSLLSWSWSPKSYWSNFPFF